MDTTAVTQAKADAERAAIEAARIVDEAQAAYGRAVSALVAEHGATAVARELGITRARVYQLTAKADRTGQSSSTT